MLSLRRFNKNFIINVTARHFSTVSPTTNPNAALSSAKYDDLINAAGRNGDFAAVRHLLSQRLSRGCLNTNNTFKFIATKIAALDDLLRNLADLEDWFARKHALDALVAQLAKLYRTAEAIRVAETMARRSYGATATTFCPVINALARKKDMAAAWRVLDTMRDCGVKPNLTAFNYILTAYCYVGDVVSAADVLAKMEAEGTKGDAVTYDALVLGACRAGKVEEALGVMRRAVEEGVPALFSTYTHIIKEMVDCGYCTQAAEFVRIFAGKNERLDMEIYGYLARKLRNSKRVAAAKAVVEEMGKRGLEIADDLAAILHIEEIQD